MQKITLDHFSLFAQLDKDAIVELREKVIPREYLKGELVVLEGEVCQAVYFIESGVVQILRTSLEGREQVLATLIKGQAFNLVSALTSKGLNLSSVRALSKTELFVLRKTDFVDLVKKYPDFGEAVLMEFAERLEHITNLVENLSLYSVRARLARFLLTQANQSAQPQVWTQEEIAKQIGSVRDVVGRTLRSFADGALIRLERNKIRLLDREKLEKEAQE